MRCDATRQESKCWQIQIVLRRSICYRNIVANRCNAIIVCNRLTDSKTRIPFQTVETHCIRVKFKIDSNLAAIFGRCFFISPISVHSFLYIYFMHLIANQRWRTCQSILLWFWRAFDSMLWKCSTFGVGFFLFYFNLTRKSWPKIVAKLNWAELNRRSSDYLF